MKDGERHTPPEELARRYRCYIKNNKSLRASAQELGINRATLRASLQSHEALSGDALEFPDFPPEDSPIEDVIAQAAANSRTRKASYDAHTWFPIKVKDGKPIGVLWFGDPHIDDNGCDWDILQQHVKLCAIPGMYGANIGDTTNNWAGRLMKKYADQNISISRARKLAAWLMLDSGVRWLIWLIGNHDDWGDGAAILAQMAKRHATQKIVMHDWEARFSLNFPNNEKINVWASHDFPGDSMWNPLHGPVKAARFGPDVDLLVCGHKHNWGISNWELADKGTTPLMIRTRGYKFNDEYARHIGKADQREGASILTIFNPKATTQAGRVTAFADIEMGVDYLQFMRNRA